MALQLVVCKIRNGSLTHRLSFPPSVLLSANSAFLPAFHASCRAADASSTYSFFAGSQQQQQQLATEPDVRLAWQAHLRQQGIDPLGFVRASGGGASNVANDVEYIGAPFRVTAVVTPTSTGTVAQPREESLNTLQGKKPGGVAAAAAAAAGEPNVAAEALVSSAGADVSGGDRAASTSSSQVTASLSAPSATTSASSSPESSVVSIASPSSTPQPQSDPASSISSSALAARRCSNCSCFDATAATAATSTAAAGVEAAAHVTPARDASLPASATPTVDPFLQQLLALHAVVEKQRADTEAAWLQQFDALMVCWLCCARARVRMRASSLEIDQTVKTKN